MKQDVETIYFKQQTCNVLLGNADVSVYSDQCTGQHQLCEIPLTIERIRLHCFPQEDMAN